MLGDFNLMEEAIDRSPPHLDDTNAIAALRNLHQCMNLQDTGRHQFSHKREFMYQAKTNSQLISSRIDSIYTSSDTAILSFNWKMKQTSVPTDHWIVITKYTPMSTPFVRKGRWTWQLPSLTNKDLMDKLVEKGLKLQSDLENMRRNGML